MIFLGYYRMMSFRKLLFELSLIGRTTGQI